MGPGCFVCPWAAARPRAVRAASFARRVVSKPGQAPPPPTGTAARPRLEARPCPPVPPAPSTPVVPGRCVCRWAAAFLLVVACGPAGVPGTAWHVLWAGLLCVPVGGGPPASRTRREPSARRVVSKPGQAPPPPTGTAAWPSNPSRCPPHQWGLCCCELLGQAPPPPTGPAPRPSGPSSGVRILDRKLSSG